MDAFFVAVLIGIIVVSYYYMQIDYPSLLQKISFTLQQKAPLVSSVVTFVTSHIAAADLIGIMLFSFFSKLFFLPLPTEPYLLYAYAQGANIFILVLLSALLGTLAGSINYGAGKLLGTYVTKKSSFAGKLTHWIESSKFVGVLMFGSALAPVPDIASLVFGASNVGLKKYVAYTFLGLLVKGYIVLLAYNFIEPYIRYLL